jgi:hypothetical protein
LPKRVTDFKNKNTIFEKKGLPIFYPKIYPLRKGLPICQFRALKRVTHLEKKAYFTPE